ncbi:unnamed protein product, partial [marine sediment metagenome]
TFPVPEEYNPKTPDPSCKIFFTKKTRIELSDFLV